MIELQEITKRFSNEKQITEVLDDISFTIDDGQIVAIVGPSGCGKTTLLRIIAGLTRPSSGTVFLDKKEILKPNHDLGLLFQQYTLFPWLTVRENIAFGLRFSDLSKKEKEEKIHHYLSVTGLEIFSEFLPRDLSGGMQQRVAIARTLVTDPKVLLLDEPFRSLDSVTRSQMYDLLLSLNKEKKKIILLVTHDREEAMFLADTISVLSARPGRIIEVVQKNQWA